MFKKKLLGAALSLAMAAGSVAPVLASTGFSDVKDADSIASAVQRLNSLGIMQGTKNADGTYAFNGEGTFTRAQAAKVFVVAKGLSKVKSATGVFKDVAKDNWAYSYVNVANQYGIVNGTSETTFAPTKEVTYGQLAAMAVRTLGYTEEDLDGSTFPYNYVQKAAELNLLDGLDAVDVDAPATRADVATVVNALLDTATKNEQAKADASAVGYVAKPFFSSVAVKFGVVAKTGTTFTATSASDSSLKANQFKIGTDTTVYTLPTSEDFSGNFYKTYSGTFYVSTKDNTQVVMFDASKIKGTVKDAGTINGLKDANTLQYTDSSSNVTTYGVVPTVAAAGTTPASAPAVIVNGKAAASTDLSKLVRANADTTVKLVDTDSNGTYDAVVATIVNKSVKVSAAPTSDDAKTVAKIAYGTGSESINLMNGTVGATVYVTGAATKLTEIKADDIVYVKATDDNSAVTLDVFRSPVTGKVTKVSADGKTVTVAGVDYTLAASGVANLGDEGTFVVDRSKAVFKFTSTSTSTVANAATVGAAVYGIPTAAAVVTDAWSGKTNQIKFVKVDGTSAVMTVSDAVYTNFDTTVKGKLCYYVPAELNSSSVLTALHPIATSQYSSLSKAADTIVLNIAADGSVAVATQASVDWSKVTTIYSAAKNNSTFGDYYVIAINGAPAVSTSTVGYVQSYTGQEYVGTTLVKDYTVYENGVSKVIKVDNSKTQPTVGGYYTAIITGTDGVTTAVTTTALASATVSAIDGTSRIAVKDALGNVTIMNLAANVVVVNKKTPAVTTLGSVAAGDSVEYYYDSATNKNVALIVINK